MSNNPLQRIGDLEARVASLTAENNSLKLRSNGTGHLDTDKLVESVGLRIDRSGQLLREDFTGKLAGLISPYIDKTIKDCAAVGDGQIELEAKFEEHKKAVAASAAQMAETFVKMRKEAAKDWKAQRDKILEDFTHVDEFVKWLRAELEKSAQHSSSAVASCNRAAEQCKELVSKVSAPADKIVKDLELVSSRGWDTIKRAESNLNYAYQKLEPSVMKLMGFFLLMCVVINIGFGGYIFWINRDQSNSSQVQLIEYAEGQKQEMRDLFDKAMNEAKESQIDREVKVKMWDALMNTLTPQQREAVIGNTRAQVNDAERKRLSDQMSSSYDQMTGKK